MKAKLIKTRKSGRAVQRIYELEEGGKLPKHVVVSAVVAGKKPIIDLAACFDAKYGPGAETFIFACDERGEITSWTELDGSFKGGIDHDLALKNAGYEVVT